MTKQPAAWTTMERSTGQQDCPFCNLTGRTPVLDGANATAISDAYPVTAGHTLVLPKRHVVSLFDLPAEAYAAVWEMVAAVRAKLAADLNLHGLPVGLNDGTAAGQTVPHAHVHVIPRRHGDVPDPRGGVRWVIPAKAAYWAGGE
jgi:diadenosine tetraphosphate (Ap4A) HIT family hydrolase